MNAALGWGSYRVGEDIAGPAAAVVAAGADWIDTAPNYAGGRAQRELAPVLAECPAVRVSTKVGFVPPDMDVHAAVAHVGEAGRDWCLDPQYVRWQVLRNRAELGRDQLDMVFVHNPERAGGDLVDALAAAFEVLEDLASSEAIGGYGVATWTAFNGHLFTVNDLVALAEGVAGGRGHHLQAIQLPLSLIEIRPLQEALDGSGPLVEAKTHGLQVFTSAPLGGGDLLGMLTPTLIDMIRAGSTPAQAALSVALSSPGVDRALISTSQRAHWESAAAMTAAEPLDVPTLRKIVDALT